MQPSGLKTKYSLLHGCYFAAYCAIFGYATAYLLDWGFPTSAIGVTLALATLLPGLLEPLLASAADRARRLPLNRIMVLLALPELALLVLLLVIPHPGPSYLALYAVAALGLEVMNPFLNALCIRYNRQGWTLHFGFARGIGSVFYAVASFSLGFFLEAFGKAVPLFAVVLFAAALCLLLSLPAARPLEQDDRETGPKPLSLPQFIRAYRFFCLSLIGILFMTAFHVMAETYLILILQRVGGTEGHLGIALAISTICEIPTIMLYPLFRRRARISTWMLIASVSFLAKAVALTLAPGVTGVMLAQMLQMTSYGFYCVASVDYGRICVSDRDAVKGQAMVTAVYTIGASLGNLSGGLLSQYCSVGALLAAGIVFAAVALVLLIPTARRGEAAGLARSAEIG